MVCNRCKMAVRSEFEKIGLEPLSVELGEVEFAEQASAEQLQQLSSSLTNLGFEIIDDKKSRIIEKIKNCIIELVHHSDQNPVMNLSAYITSAIPHDYNYLSNLFSEVQGTTIEKYFITQRIEKVKELLVYDQLSLSQIANQLGYSSVAYLSNQFKKVTGLTPSYYKSLKDHKRSNLDDL